MDKIKLYDEEGIEKEFIVDSKFSVGDIDYVALYTDEKNPEIYILKIIEDENGDELFSGIDDEELEEVTKAYEELIEELDR